MNEIINEDIDEGKIELTHGMQFGDVYKFRDALKEWSISRGYEYTCVKNERSRVRAICKGLLQAFADLLPHTEHRYCLNHLLDNYKKQFKGKLYTDLLWQAAYATTENGFETAMKKLQNVDDEKAHDYLKRLVAKLAIIMRRLCGNRETPNTDPPQPDPVAAVLTALHAETAANRTMTENLMKGKRGASHRTDDASQDTVVVEQFGGGDAEKRRLISFQKHKPPTFMGSKDPKVVTTWLQGMDKIFQLMRCQDPQKLRYFVYKLEGDAHEWWCNTSKPFMIQGQEITWTLFEYLFQEEYFPRDVREAKQGEFDRLAQGLLSMDAYMAKFNELVKYANYGGTLPTLEFLAAKFQKGLNEKIAKRISNTEVRNFVDLVTQCKRVETVYGRYPKSTAIKDN
ncbi:uncharacterized protein LOC133284684 [Gastrolobium bilobum]|uniref:uncharacterized protein LOC133284684 n=1 Tax=Gastrolobium bilobum TaxID=150636 RepID=UPI002AB06B10|nr:uncharacterized protein LOC133284684 [Gastrolobium bilobum]